MGLQNLTEATFDNGSFIARQKEIAQLDAWLRDTFQGNGQTAFIIGEPGSGKTNLLRTFANQAVVKDPDLLILWVQCNAFTGQRNPCFPFMNMTRILAGDVEPLLSSTARSLARLWQSRGRSDEAYQVLAEAYSWFTEGFQTTDLQETRRFLESLH